MNPGAEVRPFGGALQVAVTALAADALAVGVDGTLPTNQHYLDTQGIGAGTLQRALAELKSRRALRTVSRGHLGRVVKQLDIAAAWRAGGLPSIRLLLPPAGPVEITALEQVLADALSGLGIPHTVRNLRGGSRRLALTLSGEADLAVVSAGVVRAADKAFLHRALGVGTYYGPDRIAVVTRIDNPPTPPQVVAVDEDSPDHRALSYGQFPPAAGHTYIQVPFPRIPAAVLSGIADAGIWHIMPSVVPLDLAGLHLGHLSTPAAQAVWQTTSEAVLAVGPLRPDLKSVIAGLDLRDLSSRQAAAIATDSGLVPTE
jgi:hypothetical protein